MIRHVYLPPLRDAKRELAFGNPTRIHALLHHFLEGRDPKDVEKSLARDPTDKILTNVGNAVNTGLEALTTGIRQQNAAHPDGTSLYRHAPVEEEYQEGMPYHQRGDQLAKVAD